MFKESLNSKKTQIICCDASPDSRQELAESFTQFGYNVLATGNTQIAMALVAENDCAAFVASADSLNLSTLSLLMEARRAKPSMPIVLIFSQANKENLPSGLADLILVKPSRRALEQAVRALVEPWQRLAAAV